MNNVYLDILFFINFIADYITLLCTAKISCAVIRRRSILFASAIGALYACLCVVFPNHYINHPIIQLSCAILLCLISFHSEESLLRCCITFMIISSVFGGILSPLVFITQKGAFLSVNIKVFIFTFTIVYFILFYLSHRTGKHASQVYHQAKISLCDKKITLTVLRDTGNELYDPISNLPVLIVERKILKELIPELSIISPEEDVYDAFCKFNSLPHLIGRFRLIPCQSISSKDVLLGIIPDSISVDGKNTEMIVACTNNKLSTTNQYQGIC